MNATTETYVFDVAMPTRKTTSSTAPMAMYGLRRPHRVIV